MNEFAVYCDDVRYNSINNLLQVGVGSRRFEVEFCEYNMYTAYHGVNNEICVKVHIIFLSEFLC